MLLCVAVNLGLSLCTVTRPPISLAEFDWTWAEVKALYASEFILESTWVQPPAVFLLFKSSHSPRVICLLGGVIVCSETQGWLLHMRWHVCGARRRSEFHCTASNRRTNLWMGWEDKIQGDFIDPSMGRIRKGECDWRNKKKEKKGRRRNYTYMKIKKKWTASC